MKMMCAAFGTILDVFGCLTCLTDVGGEHHEQQGCGRVDAEPHGDAFDGSAAAPGSPRRFVRGVGK